MVLGRVIAVLFFAAAQVGPTSASRFHGVEGASPEIRALPNAPSGDYAPKVVTCPSTRPTIRSAASGLSQDEKDFLTKRRAATIQPMSDFFGRAAIDGFDAQSYISDHKSNVSALPNIAIAVSGGGYRALLNGAGFLAAADNSTTGSTSTGGIGGLLQATTYLAGLSGGAWLVGSMYSNNFSTVENMLANSAVWQFQDNIFEGPSSSSGIGVLNTVEYWTDVHDQVDNKAEAGFETSVTDYWGRALSYQLIGAQNGGPAYTWSSVAQDSNLINGNIPMPLLVADGRDPGTKILSLNATNFEIGPWEMGSFDPTLYGFAPTKYLGSNFSAGTIPQDGKCVEGFDNAGYMMGTSSSLFNAILTTNISQYANVPSFIASAITSLANSDGINDNDIAQWAPNPFLGFNPGSNPSATASQLSLVDGGEDLQNIPFNPLLQPERAVDVVFAVDSSADTTFNWPNGTALRASYERTAASIANGTSFPAVPDADSFVNLGLNGQPTFFGCDAGNFTSGATVPPLVVYLPNGPYTTMSNVTTFEPTYSIAQRDAMVTNGLNAATRGNGSLDAEWPACVACAALSRSLTRTGTAVPSGCTACFTRYCWNGTLNNAASAPYAPSFKIPGGSSSSGSGSGSSGSGGGSSSGSGDNSAGARAADARGLGVKVAVGLCTGYGALALMGLF